jgi:hypothetical protein
MSRPDSSHHYGFSPLAGVTAGTASILLCFGVLALAWHRVAAQVAAGITALVYAVIAAVCGLLLAVLFYVFLWLRHRVRYPETLASGRVVRAIAAAPPAAIEPPRVYLNVTDDQLAALMRHDDGERR